jgi:hypothetical protein
MTTVNGAGCGWMKLEICSGVEVGYQSALESCDGVLEPQFAFLHPGQSELIGRRVFGEAVDGVIQVAVLNAEFCDL